MSDELFELDTAPLMVTEPVVMWRLPGPKKQTSPWTPVTQAAGEPFEELLPVRRCRQYPGQRHTLGYVWVDKNDKHVWFESWFEAKTVTLLDYDPTVAAIATQPFWLVWHDPVTNTTRSHAPDVFVRRVDGTAKVINCRPVELLDDRSVTAFDAMASVCATVGWDYETVTGHNPIEWDNVDFLARCRGPLRPDQARHVIGVLNACQAPARIEDVAAAAGDPTVTLPVLYHLMWRHAVTAPTVDTHPLRMWTRVHATGYGAARIEEHAP